MLKRSKRRPHHPRQLEILYYELILQLLGRHRRCSDGLSRARFRFGDFRRLRGSTSWKRGGRTVVVVLATFALAVILTLDARLEALTILLQARALFAMATLGVTRIVACISHDFALERIRVALLNLLSRLRHDGLVLRRVLALLTRAILAKGAGGEAFAVQLETFALLAVALLTRNELSARTGILHGTRVRCQTGVLRRRAAALRHDSLGRLHAAARRASGAATTPDPALPPPSEADRTLHDVENDDNDDDDALVAAVTAAEAAAAVPVELYEVAGGRAHEEHVPVARDGDARAVVRGAEPVGG